jgi:hypothetical protein
MRNYNSISNLTVTIRIVVINYSHHHFHNIADYFELMIDIFCGPSLYFALYTLKLSHLTLLYFTLNTMYLHTNPEMLIIIQLNKQCKSTYASIRHLHFAILCFVEKTRFLSMK